MLVYKVVYVGAAYILWILCVLEAASSESSSEDEKAEDTTEDRPPVFTNNLVDLSVSEGQPAVLECCVSSAGTAPLIIWYKNMQILRSGTEYQQTYDGKVAQLRIGETSSEDAGKYECVARNAFGKASCLCRLTVQGSLSYNSLKQRFSTCGPRTIGGPRRSAWWSAGKA